MSQEFATALGGLRNAGSLDSSTERKAMAKGMLETSTIRWGELVSNGRLLEVPPFQRNYAWQEKDWEDLWSDLLEAQANNSNHYMGSVVLQARSERHFSLIDGQQRLTTLSILAAAVIDRLSELAHLGEESDDNRRRAEILKARLLGAQSPTSLRHEWKLKLNYQCNGFFQNQLLCQNIPPTNRQLPEPHRLMAAAYNFFSERLQERAKFSNGEELASFLDDVVALRLLFIQVKVEDEVSAYTVFETLNARGTELTPTDLLKNYLFSLVPSDPVNIELLEYRWDQIGSLVGWKRFSDFLRHYLNSVGPLVRDKALFREMKTKYQYSKEVLPLLDTLERESRTYQALKAPDSSIWEQTGEQFKADLAFLNEIGIDQAFPALLAGHRSLEARMFRSLVRLLGICLFRFSAVGNRRNNTIESTISRLATGLTSGSITRDSEIQSVLQPLYPQDEQFCQEFAIWAPQGTKKELVRMVLARLQGVDGSETNRLLNIEHLLPKSSQQRQWTNRLGNLVLIEEKWNRKAGEKCFIDKREVLRRSKFFPDDLLGYSVWGPEQIESRQQQMANSAVRLWRFDSA